MTKKLWEPKARIEREFWRALQKIAKQIVMRVRKTESPRLIGIALDHLARSPEFVRLSRAAATKMVTGLFSDQGHTWRQAAAANGKGRAIYEALRKELQGPAGMQLRTLVDETTYRVVTLPSDIGHDVADYIAQGSLKGRRAADLEDEIRAMFPEKTQARATLIARTHVPITSTNLTRQRAEQYGLPWYIWRPVGGAAGDGRTRDSHKRTAGVLVNWNDPPAPEDLFPILNADGKPRRNTLGHYHAGCCPNCRCYPEPFIDLDQVTFPARIYMGNRIQTIREKEFERMM